jgi:hypothetical protein
MQETLTSWRVLPLAQAHSDLFILPTHMCSQPDTLRRFMPDKPAVARCCRRAQGQLMEAEQRVAASLHESQCLKAENDHLKGRLGELEEQLGLPRTYPLPLAAEAAEVGTPTAVAAAGGSEAGGASDPPSAPGGLSHQGSLQQAAEEPLEPLEASPQVRSRRKA